MFDAITPRPGWYQRRVSTWGKIRWLKLAAVGLILVAIATVAAFAANDVALTLSGMAMGWWLSPAVATNGGAPASLVLLHVTFISILIICIVIAGATLFLLHLVRPGIHNLLFGAIGSGNVRVSYVCGFVFALALPVAGVLALDAKQQTFSHLNDRYAAWIGMFGVLVSVGGLHLSAVALQDLRHVINTFEDFQLRFTTMLQAVPKAGDGTDYVRIMAYTPLPGALALRARDYEKLRCLVLDKAWVEVTCLDAKSSKAWMDCFEHKKARGNREIQKATIDLAVQEVEDLVRRLSDPNSSEAKEFQNEHKVLRGDMYDLPNFYAYFTNDRALVINPLYFPLAGVATADQPDRDRPVELIGFETTDTYTLKNIHRVYDNVRQHLRDKASNSSDGSHAVAD